ncbi:hypothetical protein HOF67_05190 [Candidatus Peregrinibacteria bacterium]|jgi:hypothetical protein|nr:hypothetical protein [Candidatus Peregrinibacteria bacterium]
MVVDFEEIKGLELSAPEIERADVDTQLDIFRLVSATKEEIAKVYATVKDKDDDTSKLLTSLLSKYYHMKGEVSSRSMPKDDITAQLSKEDLPEDILDQFNALACSGIRIISIKGSRTPKKGHV